MSIIRTSTHGMIKDYTNQRKKGVRLISVLNYFRQPIGFCFGKKKYVRRLTEFNRTEFLVARISFGSNFSFVTVSVIKTLIIGRSIFPCCKS